jgi:hypothetical protein
MGMFDRLYDDADLEWQTKALGCSLARFDVGDEMPTAFGLSDYQVPVIGGAGDGFNRAYATIRDRRLVAVGVERDDTLQLA